METRASFEDAHPAPDRVHDLDAERTRALVAQGQLDLDDDGPAPLELLRAAARAETDILLGRGLNEAGPEVGEKYKRHPGQVRLAERQGGHEEDRRKEPEAERLIGHLFPGARAPGLT